MKFDHVIKENNIKEEKYHLSCGYYETTSFLFEKLNFYVVIHCKGIFTFYTLDGEEIKKVTCKKMSGGRGCYMDVFITTTDSEVIFQLPDYIWYDSYPYCDGESDRWDTKIIGISDTLHYPL